VTLTVATPPGAHAALMAGLTIPTFLFGGLGLWHLKRRNGIRPSGRFTAWTIVLVALIPGLMGLIGCGSKGPMAQPTPSPISVTVTATSDSLSHNTTLSITVQ
jgi:predicted small lipoprotein YifL